MSDNRGFVLIRKHGKLHIKKYLGSGGKIVIPSVIDGMPVTKLEPCSFSSSDITELVVPDSIRFIGYNSFLACKHLKKITFTGPVYLQDGAFLGSGIEEVEGLDHLGGELEKGYMFKSTPFYHSVETLIIGDTLLWCRNNAEEYVVPPHIKKIGRWAFRGSKIKRIVLPENLKFIGNLAFYNSALESIRIPDSVEVIEGGIFYCCDSLREICLPNDFGKRPGWYNRLGIKDTVINDTQIHANTYNDLVFENVKCIACDAAGYHRQKQIFPERLEYLKNLEFLSSASINVFRNDTFQIVEKGKVFYTPYFYYQYGQGSVRRYLFIFDLKNAYAEVLFYFPMLPFEAPAAHHPELTDFYNQCLQMSRDGHFIDLELYDSGILDREIPFRIKAEIAYLRCKSNYRISEIAVTHYKEYFTYHRKKLERVLEKAGNDQLRLFFADFLENKSDA